MPSRFPGMDPWLESSRYFGDFHDSLIYNLQTTLQPKLPRNYVARKTVRVTLAAPKREVIPDVYIEKSATESTPVDFPSTATIGETGARVVTAPPPELDEVEERYLEILKIDEGDYQLVTSIEVLSPINKGIVGDARADYVKKQVQTMQSGVNLIEIDLLRGGRHTTSVPEATLHRESDNYNYHVCLWWADQSEKYYLYPFRMFEPLPEIAIPLSSGDPMLTVALQPIVEESYTAGAFDRLIHYDTDIPEPPLTAEQQRQAREFLKSWKR